MKISKNVWKTVAKVLLISVCLRKFELVRAACSSSEWECDNGQCISDIKQCNGKVDCSDRSDEIAENCIHFHESCPKIAFRCIYGACVDGEARCNGVQDCVDNSDELVCVNKDDSDFRGTCAESEMQCLTSKECIDLRLLCDGTANCKDGSDESLEVCINYVCNGFGFQCGSGACINGDAKCNGSADCLDGSDEAWELCNTPRKKNNLIGVTPTKPTPSPPSRLNCFLPNFPDLQGLTFKLHPQNQTVNLGTAVQEFATIYIECKDKGTLRGDASLFCKNGEFNNDFPTCVSEPVPKPSQGLSCFLPNFPELQSLTFKLHPRNQTIKLGTAVEEYETVHIDCKGNGVLRGDASLFCKNGEFNHDFPTCDRFCDGRLLNRLSLRAICDYGHEYVRCPENIAAGTSIQVKCAFGYSRVPNTPQNLMCLGNGTFSQIIKRCDLKCGKVAAASTSLSKNGIDVSVSKAPWHVAIYEDHRVYYNYICGGSIVSPTVVISAAHCFWDEANLIQKTLTKYQVIAGRSTSNYSTEQTERSQVVKVLEVHIPDGYGGKDQQHKEDIAFLKLEVPLKFSETIAPICLSQDLRNAASKYMTTDRDGFINGFGSYNQLERVNMKTLAYHDCVRKTPDAPVADDKFCAYTVDSALVCRGDSGGGFLTGMTDPDTGITQYSLWGVISNSPNTKDDCTRAGEQAYVAITNIYYTPSDFKLKLTSARKRDEDLF